MRFDKIQTTFTGGEITPEMVGRLELDKYYMSAARMHNFLVKATGGAFRRGGFRRIADTKFTDKFSRPLNFSFDEKEYTIEAGDQYFRFYRNKQQIQQTGTPIEIVTPYVENQLRDLRYASDEINLYLASANHAPATLTRGGDDFTWTLADITFTAQPSEWVAGNYPRLVWWFENRLCWGSTPKEPNAYWMSRSTDPYDLTLGQNDADAIADKLKSHKSNKIQWVSPRNDMMLGTKNTEFRLGAGTAGAVMTPTNKRATAYTGYGSEFIQPIRIDSSVIFTQKGGRRLRRMEYDFRRNTFDAIDISLFSEHLLTSGVRMTDNVTEPIPTAFMVMGNGGLVGMTFEPHHDVFGMYSIELASSSAGPAVIESIGTGDSETTADDETWAVVRYTINNKEVRFMGIIENPLPIDGNQEDSFYVDCGVSYNLGSPGTVITGLDHLEGELVHILGDGARQPPRQVVNGQITLQQPATVVQVGLPYQSILETLPIEGGNPAGTSQAMIKRVHKVKARVHRSLGMKVQDVNGRTQEYYFGPTPHMNTAVPLVTGDLVLQFPGGYDKQSRIRIIQDYPLPLNVLALIYQARTGD